MKRLKYLGVFLAGLILASPVMMVLRVYAMPSVGVTNAVFAELGSIYGISRAYYDSTSNKTFIVYQGDNVTNEKSFATEYNHNSSTWAAPTLVANYGTVNANVHQDPVIIANNTTKNNGRLIMMTGNRTSGPSNTAYYFQTSVNQADTSSWNSPSIVGDIIYPKLVKKSNGGILMFWNESPLQGKFSWDASDNGSGFSFKGNLINVVGSNCLIYAQNAEYDSVNGKIWFNAHLFNQINSRYENLYTFYFNTTDNLTYSANGTNMAYPISRATLDANAKVFDGYDIAADTLKLDASGNPYQLWRWSGNATGIITYYMTAWNGTAWNNLPTPPSFQGDQSQVSVDFEIKSDNTINMYYSPPGMASIRTATYNGTAWSSEATLQTARTGLTIGVVNLVQSTPRVLFTYDCDTGATRNDLQIYSIVDSTPISTTNAIGNLTMTKDGVVSGNFSGNLDLFLTQTANVSFEWGLTVGYGNVTANVSYLIGGNKTSVIPNNLIPGQTYNYRAVTGSAKGISLGSNQPFSLTLPSVTTGTPTRTYHNGQSYITVPGTLTGMGVASSTYIYFNWGYTPALGNNVTMGTALVPASFSSGEIAVDSGKTVYVQISARVGSVVASGGQKSLVSLTEADAFTGFQSVLQAVPLIVLIAALFGSGLLVVVGFKRHEPMLMSIGFIFIGILFIFYNIFLEAINSILTR